MATTTSTTTRTPDTANTPAAEAPKKPDAPPLSQADIDEMVARARGVAPAPKEENGGSKA